MRGDARTLLRRGFARIPATQRLAVLHRLGRYAPWEDGFDFTPPAPGPGEEPGPPDFVGIGVQKGGTTWWYESLAAHPGIAHRADLHKERHFFDRFGTLPFRRSDLADYHGWFPRPPGTQSGEWTPDYFTLPWVPPLLHAAAPDARLLLLLRDPVERLLSGLAHQLRGGRKSDGATIADAVWRGGYDRALAAWLEHFERRQILVLQYERCVLDPGGQLAATLRFLGLDPPPSRGNEPGAVAAPAPRTATSGDLRHRLVELYRPGVIALASRCPEVDLALWPNFAALAG